MGDAKFGLAFCAVAWAQEQLVTKVQKQIGARHGIGFLVSWLDTVLARLKKI